MKCLQADEELEIGVLFDLLNQFFISQPHAGLDDQGAQCHAKWLCRGAKALAELSCIVIFQLIPWDQLSQLDPAIVTRELSSKRQEEVLERELITMLTSVHVENSWRLLGANEPNLVHFGRENCSHPLRRSGSGFSQEALPGGDRGFLLQDHPQLEALEQP